MCVNPPPRPELVERLPSSVQSQAGEPAQPVGERRRTRVPRGQGRLLGDAEPRVARRGHSRHAEFGEGPQQVGAVPAAACSPSPTGAGPQRIVARSARPRPRSPRLPGPRAPPRSRPAPFGGTRPSRPQGPHARRRPPWRRSVRANSRPRTRSCRAATRHPRRSVCPSRAAPWPSRVPTGRQPSAAGRPDPRKVPEPDRESRSTAGRNGRPPDPPSGRNPLAT